MNGFGIIKGLGVTLKHFFETYLDDIRWRGKRYYTEEGIAPPYQWQTRKASLRSNIRKKNCQSRKNSALSHFWCMKKVRMVEKNQRCTSCGICAKVCPPQCIWIVRATDPNTGRPIPIPAEFYIDVDICMNCGLCAEYCPFDAIKMDHDYEIATYDRKSQYL